VSAWGGWFEVQGGAYSTAAPGVAAGHSAGILLGVRGLEGRLYRPKSLTFA